ncbi:hypothetical protein C3943_15695 [Lysinibacillus sp. B2A1]|nr:hypothetical protein C3943_15695 [Lysinibacillus sp. B2A1]
MLVQEAALVILALVQQIIFQQVLYFLYKTITMTITIVPTAILITVIHQMVVLHVINNHLTLENLLFTVGIKSKSSS